MIRIRPMTLEDLPLGLKLSRQAGWNQVEADWKRLFDLQPDGVFIAEFEGEPSGTVTTCTFGPVAWVAMVLVDEMVRGRGIGRALMSHALASLARRDVGTVRLDATPLGQPLYETLGFVAEYPLSRYQGRPSSPGAVEGPRPMYPDDLEPMIELDRAVTGTDRDRLIRRLVEEAPGNVRVVGRGGRVAGFLMARPGKLAWQVGPCIADPEAGGALLADALHRLAGQEVIIDIPEAHEEARAVALAARLTVRRRLMRMRRGPGLVEDLGGMWAGSGPEKG